MEPELYKRTEYVLQVRILGTGTVNENRKCGGNHILEPKKTLKKTEHGTYNLCYAESVFLICWNNNFEWQVLSNCPQMEPIGKIQWKVKENMQIQLSHPIVIKAYNEEIGGVDLIDC